MTETTKTKHYRIRKELMWIGLAALLSFTGYQFYDYQKHLNWPPHGETNPKEIKSLECSLHNFTVTDEEVEEVPKPTQNSFSTDKKIYFYAPQCAAYLYLKFENSGMRLTQYIYDVEKKRRTATIVTTFDKYED